MQRDGWSRNNPRFLMQQDSADEWGLNQQPVIPHSLPAEWTVSFKRESTIQQPIPEPIPNNTTSALTFGSKTKAQYEDKWNGKLSNKKIGGKPLTDVDKVVWLLKDYACITNSKFLSDAVARKVKGRNPKHAKAVTQTINTYIYTRLKGTKGLPYKSVRQVLDALQDNIEKSKYVTLKPDGALDRALQVIADKTGERYGNRAPDPRSISERLGETVKNTAEGVAGAVSDGVDSLVSSAKEGVRKLFI